MTVKIKADGADSIEFEVKGKISLSLTRTGIIYRNELIKDGGKVLELMMKFLGLAEAEVQSQAHEQVVTHVPDLTVGEVLAQKHALLVIQSSQSGDDDSYWTSLYQADVPDWVQHAEVIADLIKGGKVRADGGGLWYRACHVIDPEPAVVRH